MIKAKKLTNNTKIVLASSSRTRIEYLRKYLKDFSTCKHEVDESIIKQKTVDPKKLALQLAKQKAHSVVKNYPEHIVIGSDQVLACNGVLINKPDSLQQGIQNLLYLRNKIHELVSSLYVIRKKKFFYKQVKTAKIFFKNITKETIEKYAKINAETVMTTVGSYKIEENHRHNFLTIMSGDTETIIGFPVKNFLEKLR